MWQRFEFCHFNPGIAAHIRHDDHDDHSEWLWHTRDYSCSQEAIVLSLLSGQPFVHSVTGEPRPFPIIARMKLVSKVLIMSWGKMYIEISLVSDWDSASVLWLEGHVGLER